MFWLLYYLQQFLFYSIFFGPCCILFPGVGLLTGVEGGGMVSLDEVPADDRLSSVSPPMFMSGVPASCSWEASTSSSSLPLYPPASATLDAVLQQRIDTKIYLQFFTIFYPLLHYGNNMHECMYVNSREKSFTIFYDFLRFLPIATLQK